MIRLSLAFVFGILTGIIVYGYYDYTSNSDHIYLTSSIIGDDGRIIHKGTILEFVSEAPEGYIKANMAISIEGEALQSIEKVTIDRRNYRSQYFFHSKVSD